ncbi:MAG: hypothetical protein HDR98_00785 [Bacteroides sp.]|nr:hypothetical protein [Bacteroides sp.]
MTSLKVHSSKHIKNEDSFFPSAGMAEGLFFPASPALPLLSSPLLPSALLLPLAAQPSCSSSSCSSLLSSLAAPSPCPFLCRGGSYQREARWCRAAPPPIPPLRRSRAAAAPASRIHFCRRLFVFCRRVCYLCRKYNP